MISVVQKINQCIKFLVHCTPGFGCHKTVQRPPYMWSICVYIFWCHLSCFA